MVGALGTRQEIIVGNLLHRYPSLCHREVIMYNLLWGSHCRELVYASLFLGTLCLEHTIKNFLGQELIGNWLAYSSLK